MLKTTMQSFSRPFDSETMGHHGHTTHSSARCAHSGLGDHRILKTAGFRRPWQPTANMNKGTTWLELMILFEQTGDRPKNAGYLREKENK